MLPTIQGLHPSAGTAPEHAVGLQEHHYLPQPVHCCELSSPLISLLPLLLSFHISAVLYSQAVEELFHLMRLMVEHHSDMSEEELRAVMQFRRSTIQLYLHNVDARMGWQSLVT